MKSKLQEQDLVRGPFKAKKAQKMAGEGWTHQARFEQQPRWEKRVEQSYHHRHACVVQRSKGMQL